MKIPSTVIPLFAVLSLVSLAVVSASSSTAGRPGPSANPPANPPAAEGGSSGLRFDDGRTALVVTDPQNDFLSPEGVTWGMVGESVTENHTVENIERLFKAAKANDIPVFISPHYYYPSDHGWQFEGTLEALMHQINMFDRVDALSLEGFEGSGADWLELYKPYIQDGATIVTSPHKVYGPDTNDLGLQLRKRGIDRVILAGMSANLCTESHMRRLIETGFDVTVVADATAAARSDRADPDDSSRLDAAGVNRLRDCGKSPRVGESGQT